MEAERKAKAERQRLRQLARRKDFITVNVTVQGLPKMARIRPLKIECSYGKQLIKWLSLTVSQRLANQKPSGMRRARERFNIGGPGRAACLVPGEVFNAEGEVLDPTLKLSDVFTPGDNECFVRFGQTFDNDCGAKQEISDFGVPKTYLSPFAQKAFYPETASALSKYDALRERVENKISEHQGLVTRWESTRSRGTNMPTHEDVMAANFKAVMADQSGFASGSAED